MSDTHAGKRIKCPSCQAVIQTPAAPAAVEAKIVSSKPTTAKPAAKPTAQPTLKPGVHVQAKPVRRAPTTPPLSSALDSIDFGQLPPPTLNANPQSWQPPRAKKKASKSLAMPIVAAVVGGLLIAALGIAGVVIFWFSRSFEAPPVNTTAGVSPATTNVAAQDNKATFSLPKFPELGAAQLLGDVSLHSIDLATVNSSQQPGFATKLRVYVPTTATTPKSIACVLVAPAGTTLLHGNEIDDGDYHDETLPYAQAGMAVVHYSLDGPLADMESFTSERQMLDAMSSAYQKFGQADAGITNARIALEFALAKLPQVDPARIYCAGHSSAATIALELAAKETRIAKVAAYAPITHLAVRLAQLRQEPALMRVFPELDDFIANNSPYNHISDINCPVFLFQARDDSNEPWTNTQNYAKAMSVRGNNCTIVSVDRGDHYQPMITTGIPKAIEWFKQ